jgi:DNA-binding transcriptional LysR family regulator
MSHLGHRGTTRLAARRLKSFDLNLLIALDALLTERSVTVAARRCGISQPTMSLALRRLREYFSDPLLIASGRELKLSAHARGLVVPVRETLSMLRDILGSDAQPQDHAGKPVVSGLRTPPAE